MSPSPAPSPSPSFLHLDHTVAVDVQRAAAPLDLHLHEVRRSDGTGEATALFVHGMCHTAAFWTPLAEHLLDAAPRLARAVAVDLPGHGASARPAGLSFGALGLGDYRDVVAQVMEHLGRVDLVVGHSMGGAIVQMLEQSLVLLGTSLARRFDTRAVALLASTLPEEIPWAFADGLVLPASPVSELLVRMVPFVRLDPALGLHARMTDEEFIGRFYTDRQGHPAPRRPAPALVPALNAPESLGAAAEMGGLDLDDGIFERPHVRRGLLAPYALGVAAFEEDLYLRPDEERALAEHLCGGPGAALLVLDGPDAVHGAPWTTPERIAPLLRDLLG